MTSFDHHESAYAEKFRAVQESAGRAVPSLRNRLMSFQCDEAHYERRLDSLDGRHLVRQ